jgi:hypothetical protein
LAKFVLPIFFMASGWILQARGDATVEGLPGYSPALECIKSAQQVYVFPNTNPRNPSRDDKHMRLLDAEARAALIGVLGAKEDWWQGLWSLGVEDRPPTDVGFVLKNGDDELVLFFMDDTFVSGSFNGRPMRGLLSSDSSRKLTAWATRYALTEMEVPSTAPPAPTHKAPSGITVVNGIAVTGDHLDRLSASDIHEAFSAFKDAGLSDPETLLVTGKDEIRGYIGSSEWMTARRAVCADHGQDPCWEVPQHQLPDYSDALRCIREAKYIHVFPVASPLKHSRDFDHSRMLGDSAGRELTDLLGAKESWSEGLDSSMPGAGKLPANTGFELIDGRDQVHLFFSSDGRVQGDFNGEYLSGTLSQTAAQALQVWETKYAQTDFGRGD